MDIVNKSSKEKLMLKKSAIIIQTFMYNQKVIQYEDIHRIEYCPRVGLEGGYIDFHTSYEHFERFYYTSKMNDQIQRAVDLLRKTFPDMNIERHDISADPFYTKNIFLGIMALFFPLIGIIFTWCAGKRTIGDKIRYTVLVLIMWGIFIFTIFSIYMYNLNNAMNSINDYVNSFYYY